LFDRNSERSVSPDRIQTCRFRLSASRLSNLRKRQTNTQ